MAKRKRKERKETSMDKEVSLRFKRLQTTKTAPSTQKARGVWRLIQQNPFKNFTVPTNVFLGINGAAYKSCADAGCDLSKEGSPVHKGCVEVQGLPKWPWDKKADTKLFARPCPERPRHGFIESRPVTSMEESLAVYKEALAADPHAELLVMPFVDAEISAVYVPESGVLIVGAGHDGATAGRNSLTIPLCTSKIDKAWRDSAGIDPTQHVYAELVIPKDGTRNIVQARSGPPIPVGAKEYVPERVVVENIIEPTDDLSTWESLTEALAGRKGVVAWQSGGSLGAHAAIHCRVHGIPYLTRDERPEIGSVIEPVESSKYPFDLAEFQIGVRLCESKTDIAEGLKLAIVILRNALRLEYSEHYSRLMGYSMGFIFRASAIACLGESRHYVPEKGTKKSGALGTTDRSKVYKKALTMDNMELCSKLATFSYKFCHFTWSSGFGGWKWFAALVQSVKLWNLLSVGRHQEALGEANLLLDMAHNGGWLLNKFCDQSIMTQCAERPGEMFVKHLKGVYELLVAKIILVPLKSRSYRSSKKWKVDVQKYGKAIGDSRSFIMTVNGIKWHPYVLSQDVRKTLEALFDNV